MVRHVKVWKQALSVILSSVPVPRNPGIRNLLQVFQNMYNLNNRVPESQRLPEKEFHLLINVFFLTEELILWHSKSKGQLHAEPLLLCDFPIVMDAKTKLLVFQPNSIATQFSTRSSHLCGDILMDLFWDLWCYDFDHWLFKLDLRRASVLTDTFQQLAAAPWGAYKKKLVVFFDKNPENSDVNVKDFFYEVLHEMMSAESGMFMFNDNETLAWFPSNVPLGDNRFFFFGLLCGLALYNQAIVFLPFPLVVFKKLLGVNPSLDDLKEFSQSVSESLQYILEDYTDDDLEELDMYFEINWDGTNVDLDPQNPAKPVTSQNKKEFVNAYVNYAFNTSVEHVFQEFRRGFFQVCDQKLVRLFKPKELQEVLVGKDFHDWEKLKQNTVYEDVYSIDHPTIQMFWEVFDELSENQKKAFLWFVTGFERVPITGLGNIEMKIAVHPGSDSSHDDYYPETHTCFYGLELPLYSTKEIMQARLTEALSSNGRIHQ